MNLTEFLIRRRPKLELLFIDQFVGLVNTDDYNNEKSCEKLFDCTSSQKEFLKQLLKLKVGDFVLSRDINEDVVLVICSNQSLYANSQHDIIEYLNDNNNAITTSQLSRELYDLIFKRR